MEFKLTINCDNAAFDCNEDRDLEIARILRWMADKAENIGVRGGGKLWDSNGNNVGTFEFTE